MSFYISVKGRKAKENRREGLRCSGQDKICWEGIVPIEEWPRLPNNKMYISRRGLNQRKETGIILLRGGEMLNTGNIYQKAHYLKLSEIAKSRKLKCMDLRCLHWVSLEQNWIPKTEACGRWDECRQVQHWNRPFHSQYLW